MLTIPSVKGFASFLSEMWSLFLRTGSGLTRYGHRVYRFTREVWKERVWLASTHYIEFAFKASCFFFSPVRNCNSCAILPV